MKTVNVATLSGPALDWAVASLENRMEDFYTQQRGVPYFSPSTNPSQGYPIIEREKLDVWCNGEYWHSSIGPVIRGYDGPTPLIAAMRCWVASKLGDTVEIPEELV